MLTSNQTSSGSLRMNGVRYFNDVEAITMSSRPYVAVAGAERCEDASRPFDDGLKRGGIGPHREDHVGGLRHGARRLAPAQAGVDQPLRFGAGAVVARDAIAGVQQSFGDATTHRAK